MQLSEKERAANRDAFRKMNLAQKAEYIFAYYKLPLVLLLVAVVSLGSAAKYFLTHKDALLYVGYTNVELPESDDQRIFDDYVELRGANPRRTEVSRYYEMYLSDPEGTIDHQYSYASRLKLLAAIDAEELDVVIMSKNAYDLLSHSGYLADLNDLLRQADPALLAKVEGALTSNDVIIEDNQVELDLGEATDYEAELEQRVNAIDITDFPLFAQMDLTEHIYVGVIGNTPRVDEVMALLNYFCE